MTLTWPTASLPSLAMDLGTDAGIDLHAQLAEVRRAGPLAHATFFGRPITITTTHASTRAAFANEENFRLVGGPQRNDPIMGRFLPSYDFAERIQARRLTTGALHNPSWAMVISEASDTLADPVASRCDRRSAPIDVMHDFAAPFTYGAMATVLGFAPGVAGRAGAVAGLGQTMVESFDCFDTAHSAASELTDLLRRALDKARCPIGQSSTQGLLHDLAAAEVESVRLDDEDIVSFAKVLFANGADTTAHAVATIIALLLDRPELHDVDRQQLIAEVLRWETPVPVIVREARVESNFFGHTFRTGDLVGFCVAAANRDPAEFLQPDELSFGRTRGRPLTFGPGPHHCTGVPLARTMIALGVETFFRHRPDARHHMDAGGGASRRALDHLQGVLARGPHRLRVV